ANLVVFNPHQVIDRATFEESRQFPEGIEHVIVAGVPAIRYGESYLPKHGKAVRRAETE
ncbi:MAG: D-aminoacylase, partial [Acidobacteria bacterium]|nr:D-aminoacylase [Acidobacteriota bacterium]